MIPRNHILLGLLFSFIFFLISNSLAASLIVFFSSFLIDIDHYFYGVYKKKTFSLGKIYSFFSEYKDKWRKLSYEQKKEVKFPVLIFHGFEFILIVFLLALLSDVFLFVLIGSLFHMFMDFLDIFIEKAPPYVKASVLYVYFSNKNKKYLE